MDIVASPDVLARWREYVLVRWWEYVLVRWWEYVFTALQELQT